MVDGTPLPSFIQFTPSTRQFQVQQSLNMVPGNYLVLIKGTLVNYYMFNSVSLLFQVKCAVSILSTSQQAETINFIPGSPPVQIQIADFN